MYLLGVVASRYWDTLTHRGATMSGRVFILQTLLLLCTLIVITFYSIYGLFTLAAWIVAVLYWEPVLHGFTKRRQEEASERSKTYNSTQKTRDLLNRGKK